MKPLLICNILSSSQNENRPILFYLKIKKRHFHKKTCLYQLEHSKYPKKIERYEKEILLYKRLTKARNRNTCWRRSPYPNEIRDKYVTCLWKFGFHIPYRFPDIIANNNDSWFSYTLKVNSHLYSVSTAMQPCMLIGFSLLWNTVCNIYCESGP